MAIAFNAAADLGNNGGGSGLTASYTCSSGANRLLLVFFTGDLFGGADDITSVTYAGTAMTLAKKDTADGNGATRIPYLYYLVNPASGANNVVISASGSHYILAGAADYTGVKQTGQPDAAISDFTTGTLPRTVSITTVADNSWTVLCGPSAVQNTLTAGSGSTLRTHETAFNSWAIFDSNGAVTPAGSHSMTMSGSSLGGGLLSLMASFSPDTGGGGGFTAKFRKTLSPTGNHVGGRQRIH